MTTLTRFFIFLIVFSTLVQADESEFSFEISDSEILDAANSIKNPSVDEANSVVFSNSATTDLYVNTPTVNKEAIEFNNIFRSTLSADDLGSSKESFFGSGIPMNAYKDAYQNLNIYWYNSQNVESVGN